jgi:thymidylate kinase
VIIALEGGDAAGKKTQAALLVAALNAQGIPTKTWDFPHYQSTSGGVIGRILRGETCVVPTAETIKEVEYAASYGMSRGKVIDRLAKSWSLDKGHIIQGMMLVDRLEQIDMLEEHGGEDCHDKILVLDRYILSAYVYGQADGLELRWLEATHRVLPQANLTFLLDVSVDESKKRRPERLDYYERDFEKLERVRMLYKGEIIKRNQDENDIGRYFILDGAAPLDQITNDILHFIAKSR